MSESWLPTLITPTPESGYELAVKLARVAVRFQTIAAANDYWKTDR